MEYFTKTSDIPTGREQWSKLKVEIFEKDEEENENKIGEYERDYTSLYQTFHPFQKGDQWYALYSSHYEETRLMELPSCRDLGKEDSGFCPVEYYVPSYEDMYSPSDDDEWNDQYKNIVGTFGFVSGCYWGDDSSWKIVYLDIDVEKGKLKLSHKFGYIQQPPALTIKQCIDLENYAPGHGEHYINIAHGYDFRLDKDYMVGYPIPVTGKTQEEIEKLPLYHDVDLNTLEKNDLIKVILKQEETMDAQRSNLMHFHNVKVALKRELGEKTAEEIVNKADPKPHPNDK